jgi:glycosyltransferase involved in cell wall biosynthesis
LLIRKSRVDLVHTNTALILSPAIAARMARVPHIWHIREFFDEFRVFWRVHQRVMSAFADVIVAVSDAVAAQFEPKPGKKVHAIHDGFPKEEFDRVPDTRVEAFRARHGLNGWPVVVVVGRIKLKRKGQEVFVKAAALLKDKFPAVRFLMVGSPYPGNEKHLSDLMALVKDLQLSDRVVYAGDVSDIKAAYATAIITVMSSSLPEPFGGVVIESMAMGTPVVGTRLGGTVEQILDGVTGILIQPDDPSAMAEALATLLGNKSLRDAMGGNARQRFLEEFTFEPFYERLTRIYDDLAAV